ncbi:WecB/TagA/CpsF family glycosyltransferase [Alicyclobacillus sp. ALC3]|nr:WecB/TagA/CpsF family glycosyltransferase [Alicyclobacillus sp. ALC3]
MQLRDESRETLTFQILGVRFHRYTRRQAVEQILHWLAEKSPRMVITAGPEFVMMAKQQPEVLRMAQRADLVTPDGIGVVWAARRQGRPVEERVTGVELVLDLLETAQQRGEKSRVYILGARPEVLENCLSVMRQRYPGLEFAGRDGFFPAAEAESVVQEIAAFAPSIWLVGLGQPRQERFIVEWHGSLPPCVAIGVGGSIDVWSGAVKRAPAIFRKLNVEWLYRLLKQPSRWRRQLALPRFAWQVLRGADRRS